MDKRTGYLVIGIIVMLCFMFLWRFTEDYVAYAFALFCIVSRLDAIETEVGKRV